MLLSPFIFNLLAAMLFGALIGAERQWRQRMAGLRTNALVATGAAVFIIGSFETSPDSPGRIAAQIVSGIGFLGAGVIMREGLNVRGLNSAATLWCSAGIGVLCGLGQYVNAGLATLIILCANILLREAAQRINACPMTEQKPPFILAVSCTSENEAAVRVLILDTLHRFSLKFNRINTQLQDNHIKEITIEVCSPRHQRVFDGVTHQLAKEQSISSMHWHLTERVAGS